MGDTENITRPAVMLLCNPISKNHANLSVLSSDGKEQNKNFNIQNESNICKIKYNTNYIIGISATQEQLFEYVDYEMKSNAYALMAGTYYVIIGDSNAVESKDTPILPISFNWIRIRKILPNNEMPETEIII